MITDGEKQLIALLESMAVQLDSINAIVARQKVTSIPDYVSGFRVVETTIGIVQNVPKILAQASPDRVFLEFALAGVSATFFISINAINPAVSTTEGVGNGANAKRYDVWHQPMLTQAQWNGLSVAAGGSTAIVREVIYQRNG